MVHATPSKRQLLIDFAGSPRRPHPTSQEARRTARQREPERRAQAIRLVRCAGRHGYTREELADAMGLRIQSVTPLVLGLIRDGILVDTSRTRPTRSGCKARVVVIAGANR